MGYTRHTASRYIIRYAMNSICIHHTRIIRTYFFATVFALFACGTPAVTAAATAELFFDTSDGAVTVGSTIRIPALMRATDEPGINVLDVTFVVRGPARITAIQTGGSIFSLWPTQEISANGTRAHIVGGTPSSVFGSSLRVVDLMVQVTGAGTVTLDAQNATAYKGDGTGAEIAIVSHPLSFTAISGQPINEQSQYLANDTQPPEPFYIELSRDASVFDGAYFLSFFTTDAQTGVARYEVVEGSRPAVDSNGTYVLHDQALATDVAVRAYDGAGNVREETFTTKQSPKTQDTITAAVATFTLWKWLIVIVSILLVLMVGMGARWYWRTKKKI